MPDIRKLTLFIIAVVMTACSGCVKNPPEPEPEEGLKITGISIPSSISVPVGGEIVLTGSGFAVNDIIEFVLTTDTGKSYNGTVTAVTGQTATLQLPAGVDLGLVPADCQTR